jgi:bifunctional DNase/RNase
MRVRYVRRHAPSGSDVAVLAAAAPAERPMIALTVSRPEALELADELEQRPTPRAGVYDLLLSILGSVDTSVASIQVHEAPGQSAQARLQLAGPRGRSEIQIEVGQAISLSVRIGKPLDVSERLIEAVTPPASTSPAPGSSATAPPVGSTADLDQPTPAALDHAPALEPTSESITEVPDRFRRAFDE